MGRWNGPMLDGHLLELFITEFFLFGTICHYSCESLASKNKKCESWLPSKIVRFREARFLLTFALPLCIVL
jgi:hypothetical protein